MFSRRGIQGLILGVAMGMSAGSALADSLPFRQCTENVAPEHEFIRAIGEAAVDRKEALLMLDAAASDDANQREIIFTHESKTLQIINNVSVHTLYGLIGFIFGDAMGFGARNDFLKNYDNALAQIRTNKNRHERIRDAYELSTEHQGKYADTVSLVMASAGDAIEENGQEHTAGRFAINMWKALWQQVMNSEHPVREVLDIWDVRPSRTLNRSKESGVGGLCRHFATLLYYNLMKTGRATGDREMIAGETAYSSHIVGTWIHVWNRVNVGRLDSTGMIKFNSFDLDPTIYEGRYVPLYPRNAWDKLGAARASEAALRAYNCIIKKK
jgi:hypothetical protein